MSTANAKYANNFDILRLLAALLVIVGHSFAMTAMPDQVERYFGTGNHDIKTGEIGLVIFFTISGYLVTISAGNRSLLDFIAARTLRILPALIATTLFAILIIGPIFTTVPLHQYFTDHDTFSYLGNAYVFGLWFTLPGVFTKSAVGPGVNGSLWTLPLEVSMYAITALLAVIGGRGRLLSLLVAIFFGTIFLVAVLHYGLSFDNRGPVLFSTEQLYPFLRYGCMFFIGAAFSFWQNKIPLRWPIALVVGVVWVISSRINGLSFVFYLAMPYLIFFTAFAMPIIDLTKIGDLSYGTYLFAYPVQQSVVEIFGQQIGPKKLILIATPIILVIAFLSSRFIERPALTLKKSAARIGNRIQSAFRLKIHRLIKQTG